MTGQPDVVDLLERAAAQMERAIGGISAEQLSEPTPCSAWRVRDLIAHVVGHTMPNLIASGRGEAPDWQAPAGDLPADWTDAFRAQARELTAVWRAADLDRMVPGFGGEAPLRSRADQQIAELATHTWDLSRATGQQLPLDPDVARHALTWAQRMLRPEFRGPDRGFAAEVPVPADAPVYDRLAGWFGRDPAWPSPPAR
jgi:uncharacterized protein (TIGR03086 family)